MFLHRSGFVTVTSISLFSGICRHTFSFVSFTGQLNLWSFKSTLNSKMRCLALLVRDQLPIITAKACFLSHLNQFTQHR